MTRPAQFDVFLCHNSEDKPVVMEIAQQLRNHNLNPWLDEGDLMPMRDWLNVLEQDIAVIKTVAVFVGKNGVGAWQQQEISVLLGQFVRQGAVVIPVLLKNALEKPRLPIFLRDRIWVDFRQQEPDPMEMLLWGIMGTRGRSTQPTLSINQPASFIGRVGVVTEGERPKVFISYSHEDKQWLKRLQTMLNPLIRNQRIDLWDDTQIPTGKKWLDEITYALKSAKIAVLLVSPDFLASDFIAYNELPLFLNAAGEGGLKIVVVHVSSSMYDQTELRHYQAANDPELSCSSFSLHNPGSATLSYQG